jgi:hypothetical protein
MLSWRPFWHIPSLDKLFTSFALWYLEVRYEHTPQLRWDARPCPPTSLPRPSTTAHTPTSLASCGVSVTSHTPCWERDRGYRHEPLATTGIRVSADSSLYASNNCAKLSEPAAQHFLWVILNRPLQTSWTFWTSLDNVQNVQIEQMVEPKRPFLLSRMKYHCALMFVIYA